MKVKNDEHAATFSLTVDEGVGVFGFHLKNVDVLAARPRFQGIDRRSIGLGCAYGPLCCPLEKYGLLLDIIDLLDLYPILEVILQGIEDHGPSYMLQLLPSKGLNGRGLVDKERNEAGNHEGSIIGIGGDHGEVWQPENLLFLFNLKYNILGYYC
jgi:hypothetical protein